MKKYCLLLAIAISPIFLWAQDYYDLSEAAPTNTLLLNAGDAIVMIQPVDKTNEAHKWLSFDGNLRVTATKKLITPNADEIIAQTYLEGNRTITRIDQSIVNAIFYVSAYVFDGQGNMLKSQEINLASAAKKSLLPTPFYILQSPDKRFISLIQFQKTGTDSLLVAAISMDDSLATKTSNQFTVPFNEDLEDLLMPLNDNKGNIFVFTASRFDSYTLGTSINGYIVSGHDKQPHTIQASFDRKKLKDFQFKITNNRLHFSALFSKKESKEDVTGILYASYNPETDQLQAEKENLFDDRFKKELKNQFGRGRKGNILNHLITLPHPTKLYKNSSYAVLLPVPETRIPAPQNSVPKPDNGIEEIRSELNYINSFVGTQPRGYARPMNYAEARNYATLINGGKLLPTPHYSDQNLFREKYTGKKPGKQKHSVSLLLLLDSSENYRIAKLNATADPGLQFSAFLPAEDQYNALHYHTATPGRPSLRLTSIHASGLVTEKDIYEQKEKILLAGYPYTVINNSLVAFYQDMNTGRMGLVKIRL